MKKIALTLMLITTIPTYATTMCAANDTVAIVLDPSIKPTTNYFDAEGHWYIATSHYRIYGELKIENGKCFYMLKHPIATSWRYYSTQSSIPTCCNTFGYNLVNDMNLRRSIFSSIAN